MEPPGPERLSFLPLQPGGTRDTREQSPPHFPTSPFPSVLYHSP